MFEQFSTVEKRNLAIYALGIFIWKFGLESLNGSVSGIVLRRLGYNPITKTASSSAGITWTSMQSINLAFQVIGVLLVGPLFKRFRPTHVLACSAALWALTISIIPILEISTGGKLPLVSSKGSSIPENWGSWNPYILYGLFSVSGLFAGIVELIRRVIPSEIVGLDGDKLRLMDSTVHIGNEIAGTFGSIFASFWLSYFGWGYAPLLVPVTFSIASYLWYTITPSEKQVEYEMAKVKQSGNVSIIENMSSFLKGVVYAIFWGCKLVFTDRNILWLVPSYSLGLIIHRYVEGTVFPFYANEILKNPDLQTILTAGSNLGELLGAVLVMFTVKTIKTPIPFVRLDAILLFFGWIFYIYRPSASTIMNSFAWTLFPVMGIISFGWSAGDVSLAAHIQSSLGKYENIDQHTTPLHAVFSFLYVFNLVVYFVFNIAMGKVRDSYKTNSYDIYMLFFWISGVVLSIAAAVIFGGSFIPRGSWGWNPDLNQSYDALTIDETKTITEAEENQEKEPKIVSLQ